MMADRRPPRFRRSKNHAATLALVLAAVPADAQWRNLLKDGVPLEPDGNRTCRLRRRGRHPDGLITINDPTYYTKPWTATTNARLLPDTELFEFIRNENEKSTPHMGPHIK